MFRLILILFCSLYLQAASFLSPDKAFQASVHKVANASEFNILLAPKIYLYKARLSVFLNDADITQNLELQPGTMHANEEVYFHNLSFKLPDYLSNGKLLINFQGCSEDGLCYQPMQAIFNAQNQTWQLQQISTQTTEASDDNDFSDQSEGRFVNSLKNAGLLANLALFLGFGVLLSLTPCVLPMLPILSSILAKKSGSKAFICSVVYVLGMALSYTVAGIIAAFAGNSLASIFAQTWLQLAFSALFIILALSSFGLFELSLGSKVQKFASCADRLNGASGAFIMGVLSALLVGPCVAAPLAGALIYIANSHDVFLGGAALFSLALGMGLPLLLLAGGFSLLKGGEWMLAVNKFFGCVLLAMAVFFAKTILNDYVQLVLYVILCSISAYFLSSIFKAKNLAASLIINAALLISGYFLIGEFIKSQPTEASGGLVQFDQLNQNAQLNIKEPKILYFTASWCENCHIYHDEIFPLVSKEFAQFKLFSVDLSSLNDFNKSLSEQYQVFGPPVIVKLSADNKVLGKITGLVKADILRKFLQN